jgi:hypothetical protein
VPVATRPLADALLHYRFQGTSPPPVLRAGPGPHNAVLWEIHGSAFQPRPAVWLTPARSRDSVDLQERLALTYGPGFGWEVDVSAAVLKDGIGQPGRLSRIWPSFGERGGGWEALIVGGSGAASNGWPLTPLPSPWRMDDSVLLPPAGGASSDAEVVAGLWQAALGRQPEGDEPPRQTEPDAPLPPGARSGDDRPSAISKGGAVTLQIGRYARPPPGFTDVALSAASCSCRTVWRVWCSAWTDAGGARRWTYVDAVHLAPPTVPARQVVAAMAALLLHDLHRPGLSARQAPLDP